MDRLPPHTPATRRRWLLALAAPLVAGTVLVPQRRARAAVPTEIESRSVSGFDEVVFDAAGDLTIRQAQHESLTIEAEPEILRKITSQRHGRRLTLGFAAGNVIARAPVRFRLDVRELRALELRASGRAQLAAIDADSLSLLLSGSGDIEVVQLTAKQFSVRISGSGTVAVAAGRVDSQRLEIDGSGTIDALGLQSRGAEAAIDGSGEIRLSAADRLTARIGGSGSINYSGHPELAQSITGAGSVERLPG